MSLLQQRWNTRVKSRQEFVIITPLRFPRDVTEEAHQGRSLQEPEHLRHLPAVLQAVRQSEQSLQPSQ